MLRRWIGLLWGANKRIRLTWALLKDNRVPLWQKAIPFVPLVYILSPLNFLTLVVPIVGQLDDVILMFMAMDLLEKVVDKQILADYKTVEQRSRS